MRLTKQRLIFIVAGAKVISKFLTRLLYLSIQKLLLSITHLALTGTNPAQPFFSFSGCDSFGESPN